MNSMTTFIPCRSLIAAAIFSALASVFTAASAADSADARQVVVKYGDLNVSNPLGAAALYGRIRTAAESVCPPFERSDLASKARMDACVHKAVSDAVTEINQPALFSIYNAKNKTPVPILLAAEQGR